MKAETTLQRTYKTNTEKVAEIRAELKQAFPKIKFSISKSNWNGIDIVILKAPVNLLHDTTEKYKSINEHWVDNHYKDFPEALDIFIRIFEIANKDVTYRETGDYGTQPSFYVNLSVGSYNKPFKINN